MSQKIIQLENYFMAFIFAIPAALLFWIGKSVREKAFTIFGAMCLIVVVVLVFRGVSENYEKIVDKKRKS